METQTLTIKVIDRILTRSIPHIEESEIIALTNKWINIISAYDPGISIEFQQPDNENRLCVLLENQNDSIMAQLTPANTASFDENDAGENQEYETEPVVEAAPTQSEALPLTTEQTSPSTQTVVDTPAPIIPPSQAPAPVSAPAPVASPAPPTPAYTSETTAFFTESKELSEAIFHDKLCKALEQAFQKTNNQSCMQFEAIMTKIAEVEFDIKQGFEEFENRIIAKLMAIYKTTCISANNTEAITTMFNTHAVETKYTPEFTKE